MVIKDKDNTTAGGVDPEAADPGIVVPAPITPVKGAVAPDGEEEKDDTRRATVPTSGGVEATINGTGEKQQEKSVGDPTTTSEQGAAGVDSAEAQAARLLQFQQKKKDIQLAFEENQRQLAELFANQEQAIVDQPEQAAAAAAAAAAADPPEEEPEDLSLAKAEKQLLDYHLVATTPLPTLSPESPTKGISLSQLQGELAV